MKKYLSLFLVAIVAMTGFLFTPTEKAEAAEVCNSGKFRVCGENDGANVNASLTSNFIGERYYWTMHLERYENGRWNVIGTRTGYVDYASPSKRVFTNVRQNNGKDKLKIYVKMFRDEKHLDYIGAYQSPYFYR